MHRHLIVGVDARGPFLVANSEGGEVGRHANVLRTADEYLGMGDVQAHLEVGTHNRLGDLEVERVRAGDRVVVDVGVVGGRDNPVRAGGRSDDEGVEVKANALSSTQRPHAFVGLVYLFQVGSPGFNQSDDAWLVERCLQVGVEQVGVQVDLHLGAVFTAGHGGAQVS